MRAPTRSPSTPLAEGGSVVWNALFASRASRRQVLLIAGLVFAVAFLVRVVHVLSFDARAFPVFEVPTLDASFYDAWARRIRDGKWIDSKAFEGVPLYPYFLALVYWLFGTGPVAIALVQAFFGALGVSFLYLFARLAFSGAVALLTAAFASFYAPSILYESFRLADGFATFFASAVLLVAFLFSKHPTVPRAVATGALIGLAALARERFLLFAPFFALTFLCQRSPSVSTARKLRLCSLLAAGCTLPLSLSLAHNLLAAGDWVVLSSVGGVNFYIGNRPGATGGFDLAPELSRSRSDMYRDARALAEKAEERPLAASEVSSYWTRRGLEFWRETPLAALELCARKLGFFWKGLEFTDVVDPAAARSASAVLSLPLFGFRVLGPLALVGLVVAWFLARRDARGIGVLYALLVANIAFMMVFFVSSRFRVSAMPCVLPFSAAALVWLAEVVLGRRYAAAALGIAGIALAAVFVNTDPALAGQRLEVSASIARFNQGEALFRQSRYAEAERELRAAIELDPAYAKAWYYLGATLKLSKRPEEADSAFQKALRLDPNYARGRTYYAALLIERNDPRGAIAELERALRDDPSLGIAAVGLGTAHEMLGDKEAAIHFYRLAVEIDPTRADDVNRRLAHLGVR